MPREVRSELQILLELEVKAVVSTMWVLGTQAGPKVMPVSQGLLLCVCWGCVCVIFLKLACVKLHNDVFWYVYDVLIGSLSPSLALLLLIPFSSQPIPFHLFLFC